MRYNEKVIVSREIAQGVSGLGYKCEHVRTVGPKSGGSGGSSESSALEVEVRGMSCTSCSSKVRLIFHHSCVYWGSVLVLVLVVDGDKSGHRLPIESSWHRVVLPVGSPLLP